MFKPGDEVLVVLRCRWKDRRGKVIKADYRKNKDQVDCWLTVEIGNYIVMFEGQEVVPLRERAK